MFGFVLFVLGLIVGGLIALAVTKKLVMPWYSWLITALGLASFGLAFEVLINSLLEYEAKAGTMSFALFGIIGVILLFVAFRIYKSKTKKEQGTKKVKAA